MPYDTLQVNTFDDGVATVVLDRPETKNAFNDLMLRELRQCVDELNDNEQLRVVGILGAADNFSSGRDTSELRAVGQRDSMRPVPRPGGHESSMFADLEMLTVALIDGVCIGGSLGFALQCDLRVATSRARIFDGHLPHGIAPSAAAWFLPRLMTTGQALRFFAQRRPISAEQAFSLGLVDQVVAPASLMNAFRNLADEVIDADPRLLRHTKVLVREAAGQSYGETMTSVGLMRAVERLEKRLRAPDA